MIPVKTLHHKNKPTSPLPNRVVHVDTLNDSSPRKKKMVERMGEQKICGKGAPGKTPGDPYVVGKGKGGHTDHFVGKIF